jgi:hypothetical protein
MDARLPPFRATGNNVRTQEHRIEIALPAQPDTNEIAAYWRFSRHLTSPDCHLEILNFSLINVAGSYLSLNNGGLKIKAYT